MHLKLRQARVWSASPHLLSRRHGAAPGAAELGMQGVQLHIHFLTTVFVINFPVINFPKILMNIISLHTHILETSAAPAHNFASHSIFQDDTENKSVMTPRWPISFFG